MNSRRSWIVFGGAVLVYVFSVTQRTSFGIAGVEATERFGVDAVSLSTVAVAQIIVYAALQIPVGILSDRWGARTLLVIGAVVMAAGQGLLAVTTDLGGALAARMLVGAGDAATFVSVARLLPSWFEGRILPQLLQWVGMIGQLGQLVSALPFALLLHAAGWSPAFLALAGLSVLGGAVALALVRRGTPPPLTSPIPTGSFARRLRVTAALPGTRLGFWTHLLGGTAPTVMTVLWGYPFLTASLGLDVGTASLVMSLLVVGAMAGAPPIGWLIARYPLRRSDLVLGIAVVVYATWAVVLLWPGTPPLGLVAALYLVIGVGGPGSLVGFDIARSLTPRHALGSVSGVVNVGGFLGGFVSMLGIGLVLDLLDAARVAGGAVSQLYALDSFRLAFLVAFAIAAVGAAGVLATRRRTRRDLFAEEGISVAPLWVALFRARLRRRDDEPASPGQGRAD
ncbi:MAG: MFS transporter [Actinomycetales bacterium]|nr:MFS transporter [Actinomycetales bacterium]